MDILCNCLSGIPISIKELCVLIKDEVGMEGIGTAPLLPGGEGGIGVHEQILQRTKGEPVTLIPTTDE